MHHNQKSHPTHSSPESIPKVYLQACPGPQPTRHIQSSHTAYNPHHLTQTPHLDNLTHQSAASASSSINTHLTPQTRITPTPRQNLIYHTIIRRFLSPLGSQLHRWYHMETFAANYRPWGFSSCLPAHLSSRPRVSSRRLLLVLGIRTVLRSKHAGGHDISVASASWEWRFRRGAFFIESSVERYDAMLDTTRSGRLRMHSNGELKVLNKYVWRRESKCMAG